MPVPLHSRRVSVAPMMDWTDRHCRYFHRLISPDVLLFSEMVTAPAIIHGDREKLLGFSEMEKPLVLQLGGSAPDALARCAEVGEQWGYDEINLNCGCPSERVQSGSFGACLMAEPQLVADCVAAMQRAVSIPVSVKSRIGIDDFDNYEFLKKFVETVTGAGCRIFTIHARKAVLKGLSPRQNREVPPLIYDYAYRIKQEFPKLHITINGGIKTVDEIRAHLQHVDGVMIGREAYHNPWLLHEIQNEILSASPPHPNPPPRGGRESFEITPNSSPSPCGRGVGGGGLVARTEIVKRMLPYIEQQLARGVKLSAITRHMLGLFQGQRGAKSWRRILTEGAIKPGAGVETILLALNELAQ